MKNFSGKILFLDRSDINTDEIIPAKYLTELTKAALKPYCLEDLSLPGFDPKKDIAGKSVIITRANFGCGSSREHAPWVLECNDINLVIAENFARIFRQNMFNCGLMAVQMDAAVIDDMFKNFAGTDATCTTDMEKFTFTISDGKTEKVYPFTVGQFDLELVKAGGWIRNTDLPPQSQKTSSGQQSIRRRFYFYPNRCSKPARVFKAPTPSGHVHMRIR